MAKGHELLHRIQEALSGFEKAVVQREHKKPILDSAVMLQDEVDKQRQNVVDTIIQVIKDAQGEYLKK